MANGMQVKKKLYALSRNRVWPIFTDMLRFQLRMMTRVMWLQCVSRIGSLFPHDSFESSLIWFMQTSCFDRRSDSFQLVVKPTVLYRSANNTYSPHELLAPWNSNNTLPVSTSQNLTTLIAASAYPVSVETNNWLFPNQEIDNKKGVDYQTAHYLP